MKLMLQWTEYLTPEQLNPFDLNPLRDILVTLISEHWEDLLNNQLYETKADRDLRALGADVIARVADRRDEVARLDGIISHFLEAIRPRPPDLAEVNLAEVLAEVLRFHKIVRLVPVAEEIVRYAVQLAAARAAERAEQHPDRSEFMPYPIRRST